MAKNTDKPTRISMLETASKYTGTDRQASYGEPVRNYEAIGALQAVIDKYLVHKTPGYKAALNNIALKLGRAITGPEPGKDTFVDGAAYFAIAGEILYKE